MHLQHNSHTSSLSANKYVHSSISFKWLSTLTLTGITQTNLELYHLHFSWSFRRVSQQQSASFRVGTSLQVKPLPGRSSVDFESLLRLIARFSQGPAKCDVTCAGSSDLISFGRVVMTGLRALYMALGLLLFSQIGAVSVFTVSNSSPEGHFASLDEAFSRLLDDAQLQLLPSVSAFPLSSHIY